MSLRQPQALRSTITAVRSSSRHAPPLETETRPRRATKGPASRSHHPGELPPTSSLWPPPPLVLQKQGVPVPHALACAGTPPARPGTLRGWDDANLTPRPRAPRHVPSSTASGGAGVPIMEVSVGNAPGGVLTVPAGPPWEGSSAKRAGGEASPPRGAGLLRAQATICPSLDARTEPRMGSGERCPLQRGRDRGDTAGKVGGCTAGLAPAPPGFCTAPCAPGGSRVTPPSCCTEGQRGDDGTQEGPPPPHRDPGSGETPAKGSGVRGWRQRGEGGGGVLRRGSRVRGKGTIAGTGWRWGRQKGTAISPCGTGTLRGGGCWAGAGVNTGISGEGEVGALQQRGGGHRGTAGHRATAPRLPPQPRSAPPAPAPPGTCGR